MRAAIWPGSSEHIIIENTFELRELAGGAEVAVEGDIPAVGYRFDIPHPWSEPEAALREYAYPDLSSPRPELDTVFTSRSGDECGRHRVRFLKVPVPKGKAFRGTL